MTSSLTARIDVKPSEAGFSLRETLVPQVHRGTEVRRRLKSAPQETSPHGHSTNRQSYRTVTAEFCDAH